MKPIKPLYVVILVIIFAAVGFYGGTLYQRNQLRASFANGAGGQFAGRFGGARGGFGGPGNAGMTPVRGQIISQGNNSITIKLRDGSSKIVNLTSQTKVNKTTSGSISDLKTGIPVTAIGTTNSDGSVTAQDVMIGNSGLIFRKSGSKQSSIGG